jgi:phosphinothricin acetyltransferase
MRLLHIFRKALRIHASWACRDPQHGQISRMNMIIRDSTDSDTAGISAIYQHAVRTGTASFELDPPSLAEMAQRREAIVSKGFPYLIAEIDGKVAGYAYASIYRARPGYRFTVENSVYVDPARQGLGIGKNLLTELVARCEADGYRLIVAVIGDTDNKASIGMHLACGFTHAGLLPGVGWKLGRWLDSVLMVRALGPGQSTPPPDGK